MTFHYHQLVECSLDDESFLHYTCGAPQISSKEFASQEVAETRK
jgi:hypothetical protein